jgi:flagellar protein FlbD
MIKLTRLGGEKFVLNADLIRYVEAHHDTFITLTSGDHIVVQESMDEVLERAIEYQRSKHMIPYAHASQAFDN